MKEHIEEIAIVLNECCNRYDENGNHLGNKCSQCECWDNTNHLCCSYNTKEATALYNAGYRKQKESVWSTNVNFNVPTQKITGYGHICQLCFYMYNDKNPHGNRFCPNCGARMKGGAE